MHDTIDNTLPMVKAPGGLMCGHTVNESKYGRVIKVKCVVD